MKTGPGNHDCDRSVKYFASAAKNVTAASDARFCAVFQNLEAAFRECSVATPTKSQAAPSIHRLSEIMLGVFLSRSRRSRLS